VENKLSIKKEVSVSEVVLVPTERFNPNIITSIPKFTYIRNDQHFKKNKDKNPINRRRLNSSFEDNEASLDSSSTNKAMPAICNPKQFRLKTRLYKTGPNCESTNNRVA